ncbi:MAG: chorismate synthase [Desulfuromonadales bacterium]|nr:chorismate synthase [Desulfuromonadales bacterium]
MIRYLTAGESHGPELTAIVEGIPAHLELSHEDVNGHLARRQQGHGRGGRMMIESDTVEFTSGVRWGKTLGSPLTLKIINRDWVNWNQKMSPLAGDRIDGIEVTRPRPGHADLSGSIKYRQDDIRNILERSSARETAVRVAVGAVCQKLLAAFAIKVAGYVTEIGPVAAPGRDIDYDLKIKRSAESPCRTFDPAAEQQMIAEIDQAKEQGDTLGGVVEVVVLGAPIGLGSYVQWDRKLDAKLAMAIMSIQAFKGVEVGLGFAAARTPGSQVHDEIFYDGEGYTRPTNRAGGIEGGMSNGEAIIVRGAMKPIPTLYKPLKSVDIQSKQAFEATVERSDACAVPAAAVVAEAVVAIEIANAMREKFGGDSVGEMLSNFQHYQRYVSER